MVLDESHVNIFYEEMFGGDRIEELQARLPHILENLTESEIQFIQLRFIEERPFKEVAEILSISENYAKVKTYRVLEKMKRLFQAR